jgi:hypothetical protein
MLLRKKKEWQLQKDVVTTGKPINIAAVVAVVGSVIV